jgi:hypothetical protein
MISAQLWKPGCDVAVDEAMARFEGRAHEATTIPGKPIPTGFKIWVIAQSGYFLRWIWHCKGKKGGPVGVEVPAELGASKKPKREGNKTAAVVPHLLGLLPPPAYGRYHVYLDNLFVSDVLIKYLRSRGWAATGTCRKDAGIAQKLYDLKAKDTKSDTLPWGSFFEYATEDNLVNQIGWKDNSLVLCQTSVYHGNATRTLLRKRPKETSSSAKTARAAFGKEYEKLLEIPEYIDDYNHRAKAVDQGDQLKCYTPGLRPIRRGGWQSIFHWLLNTVLVNSYLLSFHSDVPKSEKFTSQYAFRKALQQALFEKGERVTGKRKRSQTHTNIE